MVRPAKCSILPVVWSGQLVNAFQSVVVCSSNLPRRLARHFCRSFHMKLSTSPGKYLGINIQWGRLSYSNLSDSLVKITNRLSGWKNKALNLAGRDVLIKSVLDPSLNHLMCILKIPKFFLSEVDKLRRNFLWRDVQGKRSIHDIRWNKVCKPVWLIGLGIRDLEYHNISFLAKTGWRIASNPESLVSLLFKAKYHKTTQFLEATPPIRASWSWRSILKGKELIKEGLKWAIGTGDQVNVWHDTWCCDVPLSQILGPEAPVNPSLRVSDLIDPRLHNWDLSSICSSVPISVQENILAIPLSRYAPSPDHMIWSHSKDGNVSVKTCYNWLARSRNNSSMINSKWQNLWKLRCPTHIRHFLWLLAHRKTSVRDNLRKRGIDVLVSCPLCHLHEETISHLFLTCDKVLPIWDSLQFSYGIQFSHLDMSLDWLTDVSKLRVVDDAVPWNIILPYILWFIWCASNNMIFSSKPFEWKNVIASAYNVVDEYCQTTVDRSRTIYKEPIHVQ